MSGAVFQMTFIGFSDDTKEIPGDFFCVIDNVVPD
jgi:hypothetical protein